MILSVDLDVPDENLVEFTNQLIQAVAHAGKIAVQVDGICVDMEVTGFGGGERHVG